MKQTSSLEPSPEVLKAATRAQAQPHEDELARDLHNGVCTNPFAFLGCHLQADDGLYRLRVFAPGCSAVSALSPADRRVLCQLQRVSDSALFVGVVALAASGDYLLRLESDLGTRDIEDPYRFGSWLGQTDAWLLSEGSNLRPWEKLGSHPCSLEGVAGVAFAVWAPNARQV